MRFITLRTTAIAPLGVALLLLISAGCGGNRASDVPELGTVSGTITLNGKPLVEATVGFHSITAQRVATGVTDSDGRYTMYLMNDIPGAPLGDNTVTISTARMGDDAVPGSAKPETLPAKYNAKSTLSANVQAGDNTFDFPLQSK